MGRGARGGEMAEQLDPELISWLACERKASVKVWDHFPDVPSGGAALSMLQVSSRYNLLVAATPTGLYVSSVSEMLCEAYRLHELQLEGQEMPIEAMTRQLSFANTLRLERELDSEAGVHVAVLSRSEEWVAFASCRSLLLYSCSDLQRRTSAAKPRIRVRFEEEILACEWAREGDDRLMLATSSGLHVVAWDEEMQAATAPLQYGVKGSVTCATWLSASLILCGLNGNKAYVTDVTSGQGWGFKLAPKDSFEDEEEEDAGAVRSVISPGGGAVVIGFGEGERMSLFLQLTPDMKGVAEWTNLSTGFFQDPDLPWGPGWALNMITQQQLAVLSCQSSDATVFLQHKEGKWMALEFDDTSVLPMPEFVREDIVGDEEEIAAAGVIGVAYCNTAVPGEQGSGLPHLFLLSTEGILEVFSMSNEQQEPELISGSALPVTAVQSTISLTVGPAKGSPAAAPAQDTAKPSTTETSTSAFASVPSFGSGATSFGGGGSTPGASPFGSLPGSADIGKSPFAFGTSESTPGGSETPDPAASPFGSSPFQAPGSTRAQAASTFDFGKPPGSTPQAPPTTAPAGATREEAKKTFDFGKPPGAAKPAATPTAPAGATREEAKKTFDFGKPPGAAKPTSSTGPEPAKAGAVREAAKSTFDFGKPPGSPAASPFGDQGSTRAAAKSTFDFGKPPGAASAKPPAASVAAGVSDKPGATREAAKSAFDFGKPPGAGTSTASPFGEAGSTRAAAKSTFDFGKPPGSTPATSKPASSPFGDVGSTRAAAKSAFDFGKPPGATKPAEAPAGSGIPAPGSTREAAKSAFDFGKPPGASKPASKPAAPAIAEPGSTRAAAKSSFDFGKPPGAKSSASTAAPAASPFATPGSTREAAKSSFDFGKPPGAKPSTPAATPAAASPFAAPGSTREAAKSSFDFGKPPGGKPSAPATATAKSSVPTGAPPKAQGRDALQFTFGAELEEEDSVESDEDRPVTPRQRGPVARVYDDPIQQWAEDLFTSEVALFEEELERVDELSVAMDDRIAVLMEGRSMERIHSALDQVGSLYRDMQGTRNTMEQLHNNLHSLAERFVEGPFAVYKHAEALLESMDQIMASPPPSLDPASAAARSLLARKTTAMLKELEEVRGLLGHIRRRHGKGLGELSTGTPRSAEELYTAMYHLHGSMSALATQVEEVGSRLRRWRRKSETRARALDCCSGSFSPCSTTPKSIRSPATRASRSRLAAIERALGDKLCFSPGTPRVVSRTPSCRGERPGKKKSDGRGPIDVGGLTEGTPEVFAPATLATMSKSPATPTPRSPAPSSVAAWGRTGGKALQNQSPTPAARPATAASQLAKEERPSLERTFSWPKGERTEASFPKPKLPASDGEALFPRKVTQGFLSPPSPAEKTRSAPQVPIYEQALKTGDESPDARQRSGSLKSKDKRRSELFSSSGSVPTMSSFALSSEGAFSFASVNKSTPIQSDGFLRKSAFSGWDSAAEGGSLTQKETEKEEGEEEEDDLFFAKRGGNLSSSDSVTLKEAFSSSGRGDLKKSLDQEEGSGTKEDGRGSTVVEVSSDSDDETEEYTSDEEDDTKSDVFSDSSSEGEVESTVFSVTSEKGQQSAPRYFGAPTEAEGGGEEEEEEEKEESSASSRFSFGESSFGSGEGLSKSFGVSLTSKGSDAITKSAPATDRTSLVKSSGLLGAGGGSFASVSVSAGGLSDSWVAQSKGSSSDTSFASSTSPFGSGTIPAPFSSQDGKPEASTLFGGTPTRDSEAPASTFGAGTSSAATAPTSVFGSSQATDSGTSSFSAFGSAAPAGQSSTPSLFGGGTSGGESTSTAAAAAPAASDPFASFGAPKPSASAFGQGASGASIFGTSGGGSGASFAAPATSPAASPFAAGSRAPGAASTNSAFGQSSALSMGPSFGTPNAAAMTSAAAVGASAPLFGGGGGGGQGQASFSSFSAAPATSPNVFGGGGGGGGGGGSSGFTPPPASGGSLWAPRK